MCERFFMQLMVRYRRESKIVPNGGYDFTEKRANEKGVHCFL